MIKIISLFLIINITSSCAIYNKITKTIPNDKCEDVKEVKIFQVLDHHALAFVCNNDTSLVCLGHTVAIIRDEDKYFYDNQRIKVPTGKCITYDGVIKYEAKNGHKTVPIVKMVDSRIPNPEYSKDID